MLWTCHGRYGSAPNLILAGLCQGPSSWSLRSAIGYILDRRYAAPNARAAWSLVKTVGILAYVDRPGRHY